ncbi:MAG: ParB/RepB/Spo0J family partition protein [Pyrinomonadaceae bacterium]|nr:ParB/RepB/Spo0J family partition protein [Pyrinomonadaceae bacterium]
MMSRPALGRGLSALLGEEGKSMPEAPPLDRNYLELDIDLIKPNSQQPRTNFPEAELEGLARSIKANGIVQPIIVRKKGENYQIIAGERRWRAAQRANLDKIPSVIRDVSDDKLLELALIENIQRQELNAIEEAKAYKKLIETVGLTQETVANQVGKSRTFITNYLRLLKLPPAILKYVEEESLSVGHARALLMLDNKKSQKELAQTIISMRLSVRETEKAVKRLAKGETREAEKKPKKIKKDANVKSAEKKLRRYYATQVKILPDSNGASGKIEFEYYGEADLDRVYKLLMRK